MLVEVTLDDIRCGAVKNCFLCPVARAVSRALGEPCQVDSLHITTEEKRYNTPREAVLFILAFDQRLPVQPFSFTLE